jgi:CIC family chloride channel protein
VRNAAVHPGRARRGANYGPNVKTGATRGELVERVVKESGDFTAEFRLVGIALIAVLVGAVCAGVALVLLRLIELFTNLFYFQQLSFRPRLPGSNTLGWLAVAVPAVGGLLIGLMARYGSERIRGHGIPEALEAILIGQSRMSPKVALLKPLSSAISIGSGGPFGAEGPIIMTGGSLGSLIGQAFQLTAAERKTLLVAGAAAGMSATFNTPMAAVLLAVELLLFEWKPRSLIPVALASAFAALLRPYLLGAGPLFPVVAHGTLTSAALLAAVVVGLLAGLLALSLTVAVYAAEDAFQRLPIHWMWWPVLGGLAVGLGGLVQPRALGVGYDIIGDLLTGQYVAQTLVWLIVVKALIWAIALGSGTSGGVLAPLLILGGALGAIEATVLPYGDRSLWPLVSMAAVLGGTMRCPLTSVIFALELTHDVNTLPALLIGSATAYGFTVLVMKRSILTEKVARRGHHISREYTVDPLERVRVADVMSPDVVTVLAATPVRDVLMLRFLRAGAQRHSGYPVVDGAGKLLGVITRSSLLEQWTDALLRGDAAFGAGPIIAYDLIARDAVTAYPGESCRAAAERMAEAGVKRLPIVAPDDPTRLLGIVSLGDLLRARQRLLDEESKREQFYRIGKAAARPPAPAAGTPLPDAPSPPSSPP